MYQSSGPNNKDNSSQPKVIDLPEDEDEKAKNKEYALVDELPDSRLRQVRRGASLNLYNPTEDTKNDKDYKKTNLQ